MSLVMKKYKYNHKNYLVYERNLLDREFTTSEWQMICDNDLGIGADFIIEIINTQVFVYNMYGQKIELNKDVKFVIDYHEEKSADMQKMITRNIEVRFTNYYINKLANVVIKKANIA